MYTKSTWERVVQFVKIGTYLAEALLRWFDEDWGERTFSSGETI